MQTNPSLDGGARSRWPTALVGTCLAALTVVPSVPASEPPAVRIAQFAGDRPAALTYTFDDGLRDQFTVAVPMLNEAGLKGTFFVIPGKVSESVGDAEKRKNDKRAWGTIPWEELRQMAAQGHEIANHTWSHPNLTKLTATEVEEQIAKARDAIREHIGSPPQTLAFPFNARTPEIEAAALKDHVAFRAYQKGMGGRDTVESLNAWADGLVAEKKWGVLMAHGIAWGYAALGDPEIFRAHLKHVKDRAADIWVDTFANVSKYRKERDDARVSVSGVSEGKLTCVLQGTLDPVVYDVPLTLIVDAPGVVEAHAEREGRPLPVRIAAEAIVIDALPDSEPITISWR